MSENGFPCPVCGEQTGVIDSRRSPTGGVRRRRQCRCGERLTTYEFFIDEAPSFIVALEEIRRNAETASAALQTTLTHIQDVQTVCTMMRKIKYGENAVIFGPQRTDADGSL